MTYYRTRPLAAALAGGAFVAAVLGLSARADDRMLDRANRPVVVATITCQEDNSAVYEPADNSWECGPLDDNYVHPALGTAMDASTGCYSDEWAVVAIDTDPTHGLTWVCDEILSYGLES